MVPECKKKRKEKRYDKTTFVPYNPLVKEGLDLYFSCKCSENPNLFFAKYGLKCSVNAKVKWSGHRKFLKISNN